MLTPDQMTAVRLPGKAPFDCWIPDPSLCHGRRYIGCTGPSLRRLCRWCGTEVKPPRRSWCSHECQGTWWRATDWASLRIATFKRDDGRCQLCDRDIARLCEWIGQAEAAWVKRPYSSSRSTGHYRRKLSWLRRRGLLGASGRHLFECDHIVPRVRGGRDIGSNLRTLCVPCHKRVTAELAAERAQERRDAIVGGRLPREAADA